MPSDPTVFRTDADTGHMRHTFTGIRRSFPNLGIHTVIGIMMKTRKEWLKRYEHKAEGPWDEMILTFWHSALDRFTKEIQEITYRPQFDPDAPLMERQSKIQDFRTKAIDKSTTVEMLAKEMNSTHSDEMLTDVRPAVHTLTFDFDDSMDYPQPTPGRIPNEGARACAIGLDYLVVDMTRSNSADHPRTIFQQDSANFIAKLADLWNIGKFRGGHAREPWFPTSVDRSQFDDLWNADGAKDPALLAGSERAGDAQRAGAARTS